MQNNIVNMFPPNHSDNSVLTPFTFKHDSFLGESRFRPVIIPNGQDGTRQCVESFVLHFLRETSREIASLNRQGLSFLQKFENIIRFFYRFNRSNPQLIQLYKNCMDENDSDGSCMVCDTLTKLNARVIRFLRKQAYREGLLCDKGSMEDLIFFLLEEILKVYQAELADCCGRCGGGDNFSFPSEDEMVERFFRPIAEQLMAVAAS